MKQIFYIVFAIIMIMAILSLVNASFKRKISIFGIIFSVLFFIVLIYGFYYFINVYGF